MVITSVAGKRTTLAGVAPDTSISALKARYHEEEGVKPEHQGLWFPMPMDTDGARPVASFSWWASARKTLEPETAAGLTEMALLQVDEMTVGILATTQGLLNFHGAGALQCFMIQKLSLDEDSLDEEELRERSEPRTAEEAQVAIRGEQQSSGCCAVQ